MTPGLPIDTGFVLETLQALVRIDSVNPVLDPTRPGEGEAARYVARIMGSLGFDTELLEPSPGRVSVIVRQPGHGSGRTLMLNAHLDTVGVDGMDDPFGASVRHGRLYGRGAYDMKGAMVAQLAAAKALRDQGVELSGDLVVVGVADEEYGSLGTEAVIRHVAADAAIVTEPTQLDVCLAHKGYVWLRVTTRGRAAHGSRFDEGVDANLRMGRVLQRLEALEVQLRSGRRHPLVGPPSLHAATLHGGSGLSTYSARCTLEIERRTIPGETVQQVEQEIRGILDSIREEDPTFDAECDVFFVREPFEVAVDAEIVRVVDSAVARVCDSAPRHVGDTPWMDAALLAAAGIETVVIGPAGAGAHAAEEWVELASVERLAAILGAAAIEYCGLSR